TWNNIPGETRENYSISQILTPKFYRVKVAEDELNLNNNLCSTASEIFEVKYIKTPAAPVSDGDKNTCGNENIPFLNVTAGEGEIVNWYDAASGGNLLKENSLTFQPPAPGTFYAEAVNIMGCSAGPRTAVSYRSYFMPEVEDETLEICVDGKLILDAG